MRFLERHRRGAVPERLTAACLKGPRPWDWLLRPAIQSASRSIGFRRGKAGAFTMRTIQDLFTEERSMVTMSLGDHIEELRRRLALALLGLVVGVVVTLIPPVNLGRQVVQQIQAPRSGL